MKYIGVYLYQDKGNANPTNKEDKEMTMNEIKKAIIASFRKAYGFAPTMKAIIPLEACGYANKYTSIAFAVNGIGYSYTIGEEVERAEAYDYE